MGVDIPLTLTGTALDQVKECRRGHEAHTPSHHDRHLLSIITAAADRMCILMGSEIATAIGTATEHLGTDHLSAEATSTRTSQVIASVSVSVSASAREIGTETETVHHVTADIVADHPLVEGGLTETGTTRETADSIAAFAEPAVSRARRSDTSIEEGIDLKSISCQLDACGANISESLRKERLLGIVGIMQQEPKLRRRRHLFTSRKRRR
jgi:dihydroxyacetone kinase DhaKLM complex PTS-EIIA-like component DhaM